MTSAQIQARALRALREAKAPMTCGAIWTACGFSDADHVTTHGVWRALLRLTFSEIVVSSRAHDGASVAYAINPNPPHQVHGSDYEANAAHAAGMVGRML